MIVSKRTSLLFQPVSNDLRDSKKSPTITTVDQARDYIKDCGVVNKQQANNLRDRLEDVLLAEKFSGESRKLVLSALDEMSNRLPEEHELTGKMTFPLSKSFLRDVKFVLDKKRDVQDVAKSYVESLGQSGAARVAVLQKSKCTQMLLEESIAQHFNKGEPTYVRTFRFAHDKEAVEGYGAEGKTPAKRELDTLTNKITGIDVVMTPSSILQSEVKAKTISQMEEPHGLKWKGLPSAIYVPEKMPKPIRSNLYERHGFGDVHSFASNKGFGEEYAKLSPQLSHAEKLKLIESKLWVHMKSDSARRNSNFLHSIEDMVKEMKALQINRPNTPMRHNEFCARLEAWDARALEIGKSIPIAIASLIEFNIEMSALAKTLEYDGTDSKTFNDFLERQMSWESSSIYHDIKTTNKKIAELDEKEKNIVLADICWKLRRGVSLCTYEFNVHGSSIRALSMKDFSFEDIQSGIEKFLSTKLLHQP